VKIDRRAFKQLTLRFTGSFVGVERVQQAEGLPSNFKADVVGVGKRRVSIAFDDPLQLLECSALLARQQLWLTSRELPQKRVLRC
jgi:hypothetical protein